jgi:hypothetical protein
MGEDVSLSWAIYKRVWRSKGPNPSRNLSPKNNRYNSDVAFHCLGLSSIPKDISQKKHTKRFKTLHSIYKQELADRLFHGLLWTSIDSHSLHVYLKTGMTLQRPLAQLNKSLCIILLQKVMKFYILTSFTYEDHFILNGLVLATVSLLHVQLVYAI